MDMYDEDTPFEPKNGEVAGLELVGYKQADGTIRLGDYKRGKILKEFPPCVRVAGAVYTLEEVKWQADSWKPEDMKDWTEQQRTIGWGEYA